MQAKVKIILKLLNNPLMLLLLPVAGSICTYFFQSGYLSYYDIPSSFIELNTTTVFYTTMTLFFSLPFFLPTILSTLSPDKKDKSLTLSNIFLFFISILFLIQILKNDVFSFFTLVLMLILLCYCIISIISIKHKRIGAFFYGFISRFVSDTDSFFFTYFGIPIYKIYLCVLFLFLLSILISNLGWFFASNKDTYQYILSDKKMYAVVSDYKDKLLVMPIDIKNNTVLKKLYFIDIDSIKINSNPLILENVKGLKLEKN